MTLKKESGEETPRVNHFPIAREGGFQITSLTGLEEMRVLSRESTGLKAGGPEVQPSIPIYTLNGQR